MIKHVALLLSLLLLASVSLCSEWDDNIENYDATVKSLPYDGGNRQGTVNITTPQTIKDQGDIWIHTGKFIGTTRGNIGDIILQPDGGVISLNGDVQTNGNTSGASLTISTNVLKTLKNGNVGIGIAAPSVKLEVAGDVSANNLNVTGIIQAISINITAQPYILVGYTGATTRSIKAEGYGPSYSIVVLGTDLSALGSNSGGSSITYDCTTGLGTIKQSGFYLIESQLSLVTSAGLGQITSNVYITGNAAVTALPNTGVMNVVNQEVAAVKNWTIPASAFFYLTAGTNFALSVSLSGGSAAFSQTVSGINPPTLGKFAVVMNWLRVSKLF